MDKVLNAHGDVFIPMENGFGTDISSQRQDELDMLSLEFISRRMEKGLGTVAVDLGGGKGLHAIRMAEAGAHVTMIDIVDNAKENFQKSASKDRLIFLQKDMRELTDEDLIYDMDVLYSQRAINYVPYKIAKKLLELFYRHMSSDARIFISAAGYDTECGLTYPDRDKTIEDRFNYVSPNMQEKHGICQPITIYKAEEMQKLLEDIGFTNVSVKLSVFGNVKAIACKK